MSGLTIRDVPPPPKKGFEALKSMPEQVMEARTLA